MEYLIYSPFAIGIIAVAGGLIYVITIKITEHRERMAMIERGIHPDSPGEIVDEGQV